MNYGKQWRKAAKAATGEWLLIDPPLYLIGHGSYKEFKQK